MVDCVHAREVSKLGNVTVLYLIRRSRRIAAALGHPSNISDDAIDAEPPSDAPGFSSALLIQIKVRVTRITGCIMDSELLSTIHLGPPWAEL